MRKMFVGLLVAMLLAGAMAWLIRSDAGYVLIQFHGYTLESSVWVALLLLSLGLAVLWIGVQVVSGLLALLGAAMGVPAKGPVARLRAFWGAQRNRAANRGVIEFYQGRWRQALRHLSRTANRDDSPLVYQLLAARSAEELGDRDLAEGFLQLAERNDGARDIAMVVRAEMAARQGNDEEALRQIDALGPDASSHPSAVRVQVELLARCGQWKRVNERIPELRKHRLMSTPALDHLEERACGELLNQASAQTDNPLDHLRKCWQSFNGRMRSDTSMLVRYAGYLNRLGAGAEAERLLLDVLRTDVRDEILHAWGMSPSEFPEKQLAFGEKLLAKMPENPALLLALGRISARNRLWGKARDYLKASAARGLEEDAGRVLTTLPAH